MAVSEENQSYSPSGSRSRSEDDLPSPPQSDKQFLEEEIDQGRLVFRIRIPARAHRRTPIHRCPVCGHNFPSAESVSKHLPDHYDLSLISDSESDHQEFEDLSSYLSSWSVTGIRGRCSKNRTREIQEVGKRVYPKNNKLTIGGSKSLNLVRKAAVIESDDGFGAENYDSGIPREEVPRSNKRHKKKKHDYIQQWEKDAERQGSSVGEDNGDQMRWQSNEAKEASRKPEISGSTGPKILPFDLNDLPPMDD